MGLVRVLLVIMTVADEVRENLVWIICRSEAIEKVSFSPLLLLLLSACVLAACRKVLASKRPLRETRTRASLIRILLFPHRTLLSRISALHAEPRLPR